MKMTILARDIGGTKTTLRLANAAANSPGHAEPSRPTRAREDTPISHPGQPFSGRGIAPKILPMLQHGVFMNAFSSKGRMCPLIEKIPVRVILAPRSGSSGQR